MKTLKLKKTYDYSLFLKAYKKTAKINYQISNKNYCKYISEAKDIYSSFEQTCKNDYDAYCKEFKEYFLPHIKYIDPVIYEFVLENEDTEGDKDTNGDEDTEEGEDDSAISCKADSKTDPERKEGIYKYCLC
ncbi:hypothetical protein PVNG_05946 [Plasmodium vivax North Korean]|uniref:PIR Superfamily Protein n=1 Tax=Plasmodium vivax North Korean TaxID=1035514 RepID=A0A0J9TMS2_PLAVI|nr:hypothetical protein PVNG_05946 [Plasmodium vivax North Korean]